MRGAWRRPPAQASAASAARSVVHPTPPVVDVPAHHATRTRRTHTAADPPISPVGAGVPPVPAVVLGRRSNDGRECGVLPGPTPSFRWRRVPCSSRSPEPMQTPVRSELSSHLGPRATTTCSGNPFVVAGSSGFVALPSATATAASQNALSAVPPPRSPAILARTDHAATTSTKRVASLFVRAASLVRSAQARCRVGGLTHHW